MAPAIAAGVVVVAVAVDVLLSACGGASPTVFGPETPQRLTVTITESGVSPATVKPPVCRSSFCVVYVTFVNRDSVAHDIQSDPHPAHTQCVALNRNIGSIAPGASEETSMLGCARSDRFVGYHDETRPDDQRFWGRIEEQ
jgi:hypothetical protein